MNKTLAPIKKRVNEFLDTINESRSDFQDKTGVTTVNLRAKKSEFTGDKIAKILTVYPQLSAEWLLRNEGTMFRAIPEKEGEITVDKVISVKDKIVELLENEVNTKKALIDIIKDV